MKASLNSYISNLSGGELSILEEIILQKYKKFKKFYWLIKPYSDDISSMKYNFTDSNVLDIEIEFTSDTEKSIPKDIKKDLKGSEYKINCEINDNIMKLIITYKE